MPLCVLPARCRKHTGIFTSDLTMDTKTNILILDFHAVDGRSVADSYLGNQGSSVHIQSAETNLLVHQYCTTVEA
jgi:hypothetical protein